MTKTKMAYEDLPAEIKAVYPKSKVASCRFVRKDCIAVLVTDNNQDLWDWNGKRWYFRNPA